MPWRVGGVVWAEIDAWPAVIEGALAWLGLRGIISSAETDAVVERTVTTQMAPLV